ncbi:nascent polypeptide-associated complex subunit alpha, muscle-specific form [Cucumis melo var. makuwa]|nr:nascent polypeptide-associated complex subunit alpha, muscle-specific form [Cucumis melo var. makuwa]
MEAVVVIEQHRNQYYDRVKPHGPARFGSLRSRDFGGMNCRSFQSGAGILPTPLKACTSETEHFYPSPKTPPPFLTSNSENRKQLATARSAPISIKPKLSNQSNVFHEEFYDRSFSFSELWAGPTYSNSPPPSSLPIPKFSVAKRTTSLELARSAPEFEMHHPSAKELQAPVNRLTLSAVLVYILLSQLWALMLSTNVQMLHLNLCLDAEHDLVLADKDKIGCDRKATQIKSKILGRRK